MAMQRAQDKIAQMQARAGAVDELLASRGAHRPLRLERSVAGRARQDRPGRPGRARARPAQGRARHGLADRARCARPDGSGRPRRRPCPGTGTAAARLRAAPRRRRRRAAADRPGRCRRPCSARPPLPRPAAPAPVAPAGNPGTIPTEVSSAPAAGAAQPQAAAAPAAGGDDAVDGELVDVPDETPNLFSLETEAGQS